VWIGASACKRWRRWKRHEADMFATPPRMLNGRALVAARGTAGTLPQFVARYIGAPADDRDGAGERRIVLTLLAIEPHPWRRALKVA
jgi:hypothetical protein